MRRIVLVGLLALYFSLSGWAQVGVPSGFGYQALVFESGKPAKEKGVGLKVYLQDAGGEVFYSEEHAGLTTSGSGVVSVTVGTGQGLSGSLAGVPWGRGIWIASEVNLGDGYASLGAPVKLQSVPYALFAMATPRVQGTEAGAQADAAIFEVKDSKGGQVFGVYESGVRFAVTDDESLPDGTVSGFVLSSRSLALDGSEEVRERLRVGNGGVHITVDEELRGVRGGFAVATRSRDGGAPVERMGLAQDAFQLTVDDMDGRGVRGGFAVATRSSLRGEEEDGDDADRVSRMRLEDGGIRFLVDPVRRGVRGGFAVATRSALRAEKSQELFMLNNRESYFTVRPGESAGFSFRDRENPRKAIMNVTGQGKIVSASDEADKVLKPMVPKEVRSMSVHDYSVGFPETLIRLSDFSRWAVVGLQYEPSEGVTHHEIDVTIKLPEGLPMEVVTLIGLDGKEYSGLRYTGTNTPPDKIYEMGDVEVCMRNFPDKCAKGGALLQCLLTNRWLHMEDLVIGSWVMEMEDGELVEKESGFWEQDVVGAYPLVIRNAKLEFTSSVEGFYGVIERGIVRCTNKDPEWLKRVKDKDFGNVEITLTGDVVNPDAPIKMQIPSLSIMKE